MKKIFPELPLILVSEFPPPSRAQCTEWIRYHIRRRWPENYALVRSRLRRRKIRIAAVILEPRTPYWKLRLLGFALAPLRFLAFNEHGEHFMLRPTSLPVIVRHILWRAGNFVRWQFREASWLRRFLKRVRHPREFRRPILYRLALLQGCWFAPWRESPRQLPQAILTGSKLAGISVVIPSRNGRELLETCLPCVADANEIIVVDNGSDDGTVDLLREAHPAVVVELNAEPLPFAMAVNRGIRRARFSHICVLNNDMIPETGFLDALRRPFDNVPDLFAATAQIFFPEGRRREETGKTVMPSERALTDFPVRCDEPLEGEDQSYVLYGSGGCTLYNSEKLAALGGFDEAYEPAYVEDLDVGVRAWQRGWPSVYCARARVLHLHRATTSRYFTAAQLERAFEYNYVRFLARAVADRRTFRRLWRENVVRLNLLRDLDALAFASGQPTHRPRNRAPTAFLHLVNGDVAVFPGRPRSRKPMVLVASPYIPFPLSHGAAVRIYNLMSRTARDFDHVLVTFVEESVAVPLELREICVEIVTVRRPGSHALPSTPRPDAVEEFDLPSFHAGLRQTVAKWHPCVSQLEFTQMAQYAPDCHPSRTILVEHDVTYDLYAQMLAREEDWETRRQYERWAKFETEAWTRVDRTVTMSERDRQLIPGAVTIPNGVDLDRFKPSIREPDPRRLLFIGSFAHQPNVLAVEFFLSEVWPSLTDVVLHVIAGHRHERFWDLRHPGVEVEGFVADVRPAYERAVIVVAPLVASAGTNIKIMEAMAMGKAIVSTEAGIHGLELERGRDLLVANSAEEMARAIARLLDCPQERTEIGRNARQTAERLYGWNAIAEQQMQLYRSLMTEARR